ncbi:MAG TPA: BMP family ABC transporter substrate-binding protein [Solirubrobacterales bacterium]
MPNQILGFSQKSPHPRYHGRLLLGLLFGALFVTLLSACGSSEGTGSTSAPAAASGGKAVKVGVVTDVGGLNDHGFNALAKQGLEEAEQQLGAEGRLLTSATNADYALNLSTLAEQGYELVIGVGFLMTDAVNEVATKFPETKFAIVDVSQSELPSKPSNVEGLVFEEQQAGYLAGYLAGDYAKSKSVKTVSSVGGEKIPPVDGYIAGYQAGAKAADPSITTLNGYSQDFADQAKCKEVALEQIQQGSGIVFAVASSCGLGALDAAREQGVLGIGVDADQGYLGEYILTSATKKVNVAVLSTAEEVQKGSFVGGRDHLFDLSNGGVGLGRISPAGEPYAAALAKVKKGIEDGSITVPKTLEE